MQDGLGTDVDGVPAKTPVGHVGIAGYLEYRPAGKCLQFLPDPRHPGSKVSEACSPTVVADLGASRTVDGTYQHVRVLLDHRCLVLGAADETATGIAGQEPGATPTVQNAHDGIALGSTQNVDKAFAQKSRPDWIVITAIMQVKGRPAVTFAL